MKITILPYDPNWVSAFEIEKEKIERALADLKPVIDHIGSTSVPGLSAKPIIDILIGVDENTNLDDTIQPMVSAGYTYFRKFEPGMPYRRLFVKLDGQKTSPLPEMVDVGDERITGVHFFSLANIHLMKKADENWERHLAFRDYLRAHDPVRIAYQELKLEISKGTFRDTMEYNDLKNDFIKKTEKEALIWFGENKEGDKKSR